MHTAMMVRGGYQDGRQSVPAASPAIADRNVGETERWVSMAGGGLLALLGLAHRSLGGVALAGVGAGLVYRGLTGHCPIYEHLGLSTSEKHGPNARVAAGEGCRVEASVDIDRPAGELYTFWRDFENLPQVMSHLRSVTVQGHRSHWEAAGPAGTTLQWDAEVINERPSELIAWGSLPGSEVDTAGSVHFTSLSGRGTRVTVNLKYDPPAGKAGAIIARVFGRDAQSLVEKDLDNFKRKAEANELTATGGHAPRFAWKER